HQMYSVNKYFHDECLDDYFWKQRLQPQCLSSLVENKIIPSYYNTYHKSLTGAYMLIINKSKLPMLFNNINLAYTAFINQINCALYTQIPRCHVSQLVNHIEGKQARKSTNVRLCLMFDDVPNTFELLN